METVGDRDGNSWRERWKHLGREMETVLERGGCREMETIRGEIWKQLGKRDGNGWGERLKHFGERDENSWGERWKHFGERDGNSWEEKWIQLVRDTVHCTVNTVRERNEMKIYETIAVGCRNTRAIF